MGSSVRKLMLMTALLLALLALPLTGALAQDDETETDTAVELPASFYLQGFTHIYQTWNNCGPATLTMGLTFYGYEANQARAANWMKPNYEDKNVSPWQMVEFVNTQVPELPVFAIDRYGGTPELLKTLIYNRFPVLIEAGYDPASANQGWMGHYLLVVGWDDGSRVFTTQDSYDGPNLNYSYDHIDEHWSHFNFTYIVIYTAEREAELMDLLGDDADERTNYENAFERSSYLIEEEDGWENGFLWHNLGTNLSRMGWYEQAADAFDQARNLGLPWRMLWYQFEMYETYLQMGRYNDVLALANTTISDGGGQYVEESYYYAARAREGLGETARAINNYQQVVNFNPNFTPARERLDFLQGVTDG